MSTPLSAATSISTPRVNSMPILSTPSLVKPLRVAISSDLKQLYSSPSMPWCENMSNCVPTWPISLTTSSSLLMRLLLPIGPPVRLVVQVEAAGAEQRHVRGQRPAQLEHLAGADQPRGVRDESLASCSWRRRARPPRPISTDSAARASAVARTAQPAGSRPPQRRNCCEGQDASHCLLPWFGLIGAGVV